MPTDKAPGLATATLAASATPDADGDQDAAYLAALGHRLRRLRAVRGMSRKVLAQASGLSERYIAQIESGTGNASIILLRRIAKATGVPLDNLIHEDLLEPIDTLIRDLLRTATPEQLQQVKALLSGPQSNLGIRHSPQAMTDRIALIGLRGAGKTTLGRHAAQRLGWTFSELNAEIEHEQGFSMTDIFTLYGQDGYRRFEQDALRRVAQQNGPMILATGGGVVAEPVTLEFLLSSFFTIWIKAPPEAHMARVRGQGDLRPMAHHRSAMNDLKTILSSREPLYRRAHAIVDTTGTDVEQSLQALLDTIMHFRNLTVTTSQ